MEIQLASFKHALFTVSHSHHESKSFLEILLNSINFKDLKKKKKKTDYLTTLKLNISVQIEQTIIKLTDG